MSSVGGIDHVEIDATPRVPFVVTSVPQRAVENALRNSTYASRPSRFANMLRAEYIKTHIYLTRGNAGETEYQRDK